MVPGTRWHGAPSQAFAWGVVRRWLCWEVVRRSSAQGSGVQEVGVPEGCSKAAAVRAAPCWGPHQAAALQELGLRLGRHCLREASRAHPGGEAPSGHQLQDQGIGRGKPAQRRGAAGRMHVPGRWKDAATCPSPCRQRHAAARGNPPCSGTRGHGLGNCPRAKLPPAGWCLSAVAIGPAPTFALPPVDPPPLARPGAGLVHSRLRCSPCGAEEGAPAGAHHRRHAGRRVTQQLRQAPRLGLQRPRGPNQGAAASLLDGQ